MSQAWAASMEACMKKSLVALLVVGGIAAPAAIMAGGLTGPGNSEPIARNGKPITDAELQAMQRDVPLAIPSGSVDGALSK
jgi:hypothetical protein